MFLSVWPLVRLGRLRRQPSPREGPTTLTASMHDAEGMGNSVALMYYSGSTMFAVCEAHEA